MRKITGLASKAFWDGENFSLDNTTVKHKQHEYIGDITYFYLHGNMIAKTEKNIVLVSSCGYRTNITKERLNGVLDRLGYKVYQKKGVWYVYNFQNEESVLFEDNMQFRLGA